MVTYASIYEALFNLTSVMLTHFRENFIGKDIDTDIWRKNLIVGTGTFAMTDLEDEGYSLTTSAATNDRQNIDANNIRQFSNTASSIISVFKRVTGSALVMCGFVFDNAGVEEAYVRDFTGDSFKTLVTTGSSIQSATASSIAVDTAWHVYQIKLTASDCKLYIDGVLQVTKTTNLPAQRLQPTFYAQTYTTAAAEGRIKYFEAWNTQTGGIYGSIYELFNKLTTVSKQWFVEWFIGSGINTNIWTLNNPAGTDASGMSDLEDEGFEAKCSTTVTNNETGYAMNNKRQFIHNSSFLIAVARLISVTNNLMYVGLFNTLNAMTLTQTDCAFVQAFTLGAANFTLQTGDASTQSGQDSGVAVDTNFHVFKIDCQSSNILLYIDGVLKVTKPTNRPTVKLQPRFGVYIGGTGTAPDMRIKYLEARNV